MTTVTTLVRSALARIEAGEAAPVVLRDLATEAWASGRASCFEGLMTADEVATELGIATSTLRQIAGRRGVGRQLGAGARAIWLFTSEDLDALRDRRRGRPPKPKPKHEPAPAEEPPKPTRSRRTAKGAADAANHP